MGDLLRAEGARTPASHSISAFFTPTANVVARPAAMDERVARLLEDDTVVDEAKVRQLEQELALLDDKLGAAAKERDTDQLLAAIIGICREMFFTTQAHG